MPSCTLNFDSCCQALRKDFPQTYIINNIPLKVFGCFVYARIPHQKGTMLDMKVVKCTSGIHKTKKGTSVIPHCSKILYLYGYHFP